MSTRRHSEEGNGGGGEGGTEGKKNAKETANRGIIHFTSMNRTI